MARKGSKWVRRIGAILCLALFIAAGYSIYRLHGEREALRREVAGLEERAALLKKKYAEQKAVAEAMLRARQAAENRARNCSGGIAELERQKEELAARLAESKAERQELVARHEARVAELEADKAKLRQSFAELRDESNRIIREKNGQITSLTGERDSLQASLDQETAQHKRCRSHNARLAELSAELVDKYEGKGVLGTIAQSEPFTQLKKVELEQLIQEYRDRIDKDTL